MQTYADYLMHEIMQIILCMNADYLTYADYLMHEITILIMIFMNFRLLTVQTSHSNIQQN